MFGLFKRKLKVPAFLDSGEDPKPFVWMNRVIHRPTEPVVWPLDSEAFHGWRVKPNPELGFERDTYFLNAKAPQFTFASPWPITTRAFLDKLDTAVLNLAEHWSPLDSTDVYLYDPDEVREAFSHHERYLLSDIRDSNAEQLKIVRNHGIKLTPASADTQYLKLSSTRHPMLERDKCVFVSPEDRDGGPVSTLRINSRQLHTDQIGHSFGLILNHGDAHLLREQLKDVEKYFAQAPLMI